MVITRDGGRRGTWMKWVPVPEQFFENQSRLVRFRDTFSKSVPPMVSNLVPWIYIVIRISIRILALFLGARFTLLRSICGKYHRFNVNFCFILWQYKILLNFNSFAIQKNLLRGHFNLQYLLLHIIDCIL